MALVEGRLKTVGGLSWLLKGGRSGQSYPPVKYILSLERLRELQDTRMRICSLLPSATEIAFALGLGDQVVAVSHECDYPHEASNRPVLTKSAIHQKIHRSLEVDLEVEERRGDIYEIDEKLLQKLKPDLILTQELCHVCAVSYTKVKEAARILDADTKIVSLEPTNLEEIVDNILLVGRMTGKIAQAEKLSSQMLARMERVKEKTERAE